MNKSTWDSTVKPVVVLSVIALVVSFLLALVNSFTAPIIDANQKAATLAAYVDVMPTVSDAKTLEEVTGYTTENVTGVVKAAAILSLDSTGDVCGGVAAHLFQGACVGNRGHHVNVSSQGGCTLVFRDDRSGHGVNDRQQQADDQRDHAQHNNGLYRALPSSLIHLPAASFAGFAGLI